MSALDRGDYGTAADQLAVDGRFGPDLEAVAERLRAGGPALVEEAHALLRAAHRSGAITIEEVIELSGGRELRTRK